MENGKMVPGVMELQGVAAPPGFVGLDELLRRMLFLSVRVWSTEEMTDHVNLAISELFLLQKGLERLKSDRSWMDAADVDGFIDRLMHG